MKNKSSYFQAPVEHQINQIAKRTVPPFGWFWLSLLVIAIGALVVWAIVGTVQVNIYGRGIILNQSGLFSIQTPIKGIVRNILVKSEDIVQKGDLIAEVYDAQKDMLLKTTQIQIDALTKEVDRLRRQVEIETEASKQSLESQLVSLEFDVKTLQERLQFLDRELKKKEGLYREGLIILNVVQETQRQIAETKVSLEEKKGEIADIHSKLMKSYRTEELKTKELELLKAQGEAAVIKTSLEQAYIRSSGPGKILEILVNPGEVVDEGQSLVNVEFLSENKKFVFYGYFPSELGKYVRKGNVMKMALSNVSEKEFGAIVSRIDDVSDYAVSEKAIINLIHNANLARFLSNHQPVTQVIATPIENSQDPSGYTWTSGKGPLIDLSTGAVGDVEVTIENVHPIYYLIPLKQFKQAPQSGSL